MKILLANKFFFMNGGSERVFFQERDFLLKNGIHVMDFAMEDPRNLHSDYASYFVSNINYHAKQRPLTRLKQAAKFIHSREAVSKLESLVKNERPNIAHLHNIYHQLTPSIISVLKRNHVKVVLTLHDAKLICPNYLMLAGGKICSSCCGGSFWKPFFTNCTGSRIEGLLLAMEAYYHKWIGSYDMVDLYLSPSRFLAGLLGQRITHDRIRLLPNGVDVKRYPAAFVDQGYALYFGRLSREKGIETLLEAHKAVCDAIELKVVGTGPLEAGLRDTHPQVSFLGYQSGEALQEIVANSAFVVVPSEWYENCSMVVLEAMALGKPVIGSRTGGIPEQVEDGITGLLFEMGNVDELAEKMKLLARRPDLRSRMGQAARTRLEQQYSLEGHCTKLLAIYESLLSRN
jgi:glycosyltransferase involved in cell wall biosynthesis